MPRTKISMRRRTKRWVGANLSTDLRALTIQQPFAWAVVQGFKCVENRTRPPPKALIGQVIAIHAGAGRFDEGDVEAVEQLARIKAPTLFSVGAIVGFARLAGWTKGPRSLSKTARRWYYPGSHAWLLDDVYALKSEVSCGGQLGFWRVKGAALRGVRRGLR